MSQNIKLGTCSVSYGGNELGLTIGGVEMVVTTSTHETKVDQFGDTIISEHITGRTVTVKVPMAETTLENLVRVMPGAELVGATAVKKVVVKTGIGMSLLSAAKPLILHPIALPKTNKTEDVTIHLAATSGAMTFSYKIDEERVFPVEFKGYADPVTGVLYTVGDPAIV